MRRFRPEELARLTSIHPEVPKEILSARTPIDTIDTIDTIVPNTPYQRLQACKSNVARLPGRPPAEPRLPGTLHEHRPVASRHGLFAAQSALGHADPRTTTESYAAWLDLAKVVKVF